MFGALIRAAERWKSIKVTEFERRQLSAVKKELDQGYEVQVDLKRKPSKGAVPNQNIQQFSDLTKLQFPYQCNPAIIYPPQIPRADGGSGHARGGPGSTQHTGWG